MFFKRGLARGAERGTIGDRKRGSITDSGFTCDALASDTITSEAATKIYNSLRVGASSTNAQEVKAAFESVYPQLGLTCADIGGLWNEAGKDYYPGMEPCTDATTVITQANSTLAIAFGVLG